MYQRQQLGKIITGPTYKLPLNLVIPDDYMSFIVLLSEYLSKALLIFTDLAGILSAMFIFAGLGHGNLS